MRCSAPIVLMRINTHPYGETPYVKESEGNILLVNMEETLSRLLASNYTKSTRLHRTCTRCTLVFAFSTQLYNGTSWETRHIQTQEADEVTDNQ